MGFPDQPEEAGDMAQCPELRLPALRSSSVQRAGLWSFHKSIKLSLEGLSSGRVVQRA
jgi:hypothetical protein